MRKRTVMFESWRGRYSDSPRRISELLGDASPPVRRLWVTSGQHDHHPEDVAVVRRHSAAYFRALLTTDVLVTNDIVSQHLVKGPRVRYLQMWHGTPLKLIGLDERAHAYSGAEAHLKRMRRDVAKWDYLVSPSPVCTDIFRSAFGYDGEIWETGYPRNDVLKASDAGGVRDRVRADLGIAPDALVVLYAPTWRDDSKDASGQFQQSVDLDRETLRREAPEGTVLLTRLHQNVAVPSRPGVDRQAIDVSRHPEISELYLAADVLVSDYSSAVYDFAVTGKPIVLYAPDLERYRDSVRGMYFDYESWAPGPVVATTEAVAKELHGLGSAQASYEQTYTAFVEKFCPHEDGRAGQRVLERLASVGGL
jgi:CDP-glycerol glycerophosphotransferase